MYEMGVSINGGHIVWINRPLGLDNSMKSGSFVNICATSLKKTQRYLLTSVMQTEVLKKVQLENREKQLFPEFSAVMKM